MVSSSPLPVVGLDVSKATLAVCCHLDHQVRHLEVRNDKPGFAQILQVCGAQSLFVLEARGTYYLALAYYLHEQGGQVAVLNPLIIRRFIQMHLGKRKTDRKDAHWLLRYGQQQAITPWQPAESVLVECRQLEQVTEQLLKQKTMVSNSLEALQRQPVISPLAQQRLQQTWQLLDDRVQTLEAELLTLLETRFKQEMTLLRSIPGIGRKTAGLLLLFAGGFTRLDNYRQLLAKAGLSPREYTCGTSVRGKVRSTKMGG